MQAGLQPRANVAPSIPDPVPNFDVRQAEAAVPSNFKPLIGNLKPTTDFAGRQKVVGCAEACLGESIRPLVEVVFLRDQG